MDEGIKIDYQLTADIYKHFTGYRFTMFGFFVTVMLAINGAAFYVLSAEKTCVLGFLLVLVAILIAMLAISMDIRTVSLYELCVEHARCIEKIHFCNKPYKGILSVIEAEENRPRWIQKHKTSIRTLYILPMLSAMVIFSVYCTSLLVRLERVIVIVIASITSH
jgi:hypothetical protein